MFFVAAALFGGMILLPLYWQSVRHESVIVTGLLTAPQGIGAAMMMPVAGRLTDRIGGGPLTLFGVLLTAVATVPFALIGPHTSIVFLCAVMVIRGFGIGFAFMPAMSAAFASLSRDQLSDATPQLNVLQRVGGSIGIAVLTVVLQRSLVHAHTLSQAASSYGTAFWWAVGLTGLAIPPSILLMRAERRAAAAAAARRARGSDGGGDGRMSTRPTDAPTERDAATALGDSFKTLMGAVRRLRGRETHSHDGLSNAQFQLLFGLRAGKLLSGGELACVAGLSPATTTQMLDGLEAAGLVVRERSLQDRRKVMTSLTERGHALVEQRHARFAPMWRSARRVLRRRARHRRGRDGQGRRAVRSAGGRRRRALRRRRGSPGQPVRRRVSPGQRPRHPRPRRRRRRRLPLAFDYEYVLLGAAGAAAAAAPARGLCAAAQVGAVNANISA